MITLSIDTFQRHPHSQFPLVPPPTRPSDTKCHSSLHQWYPCCSFLPLQSPQFLLRTVARPGNGYACRILWPLPDLMDFGVQSFNSLGQNPCAVAAYMMSTCSQGCKSVAILPALVRLQTSHLLCSVHHLPAAAGSHVQW